MFGKLFGKDKKSEPTDSAPEILGLRLGGAFNLDELKLKLIEPNLIVEGVAKTQFIQAVGKVELDSDTTVLRFYTDDDGFVQVLLSGGMNEEHISDVKLWYYYDTTGVSSDSEWNSLLSSGISFPEVKIDDYAFNRVWESTGGESAPVAMTEKTYTEGNKVTETDQFVMLYEREASEDSMEYAMISGEEKIIGNQADRCLVRSTGFDLQPADIDIIG